MAVIKCTIDKSKWYEIYIEYQIDKDGEYKSGDKTIKISHALKLKKLTSNYDFSGTMKVSYSVSGNNFAYDGNVNIIGKASGFVKTIKSGTTAINRNITTGGFAFKVSCSGSCNSGGYGPGNIVLASKTITLPKKYINAIYDLTITKGVGSSIIVNRTSSGGNGSIGILSSGTNKLYYGDKLNISFSANNGYRLGSHTVNGDTFKSGATYVVTKNVVVKSSATPLASKISATNAKIGSNSTITVQKANSSYTHTITYSFKGLTGNICTKSPEGSISWTVPTTFYAKIPNAKSDKCTLTCDTYSGDNKLGSSSYTLTVTATGNPSISKASVVDINETTLALTGNEQILIRYMSKVKCSLTASANNSATISDLKINGAIVTNSNGAGIKTYENVDKTSFLFSATDSRGYSATKTLTPTIVPYVKLTCNPILRRSSPTSNEIVMTISGNMYVGNFGTKDNPGCTNTLQIGYRYKKSSESSYGGWLDVDSTKIGYGTSTYRSTEVITLNTYPNETEGGFDYNTSYDFQIYVCDGAKIDGTNDDKFVLLSDVTVTKTVKRGVPVFDWGENDFNFNVIVNHKRSVNFGASANAVFSNGYGGIRGINSVGSDVSVLKACGEANDLAIGWGNYNAALGSTDIYGNKVNISTKKDLSINGREYGANKILWSGGHYMSASQTITLSEAISKQPNGIVLVFSRYIDGAVNNSTFSTHFVSKCQISAFPNGGGYTFFLVNNANFTVVGAKYLKITNTQISGDDSNITTETTTNGISHTNKGFVLRYVIGV